MKLLAVLALTGALAFAQDGAGVNVTLGNPYVAYQKLIYNSSNNITYVCMARSVVGVSTVTTTTATNASPVVITATAHNFGDYGNLGATVTPIIKITGGTGSWAAINGTWTATPTTANAFSIPVDSSAFGALAGTLVVTTTSPRHNVASWSIFHLTYDGSNNTTSQGWAQRPGGAGATSLNGGSTGYAFKCSERATLAYQ